MTSKIDQFISSCKDWNSFFAVACDLDPSAQSDNPSKGKVFERLTQLYLLTHPEYQTKLKNVWLAPDLPRAARKFLALPAKDEGVDLVAETYEGEYWAIQCKFRSDTSKALTVTELSTFTNLSFNVCKNFTLALVVHTCAKPVKKKELLGNTAEVGLDRWLQISDEDWQRIRLSTTGKSKPPVKRKPRDHQKQAIAAAQQHFVSGKASRGRLIMPCGTGKSLTAFWIAEALDAKAILVAVPSLYLIKAGIEDWTRESVAKGERPEWLVVCSDESTGKVEQDEFVGQVYDLGVDTTTDTAKIQRFLKKRTQGRKIVFCTYQSGKVLAEAVQSVKAGFDLGIFDEAHRTVGNPDKAFSHLVSDSNIRIKRRLFMTATERVARGANDDVLSMDDVDTYGDRFYQLTFKQAIHSDPPIICDYKIITIAVSDLEVRELIEQNRYLTPDEQASEREAITLAAGIALQRMFDEKGVTHAITFHRSIRAAEGFKEQHEKLITANHRKNKPACFHVSSKKTTGERAGLIQDYRNETKAIMTNARCLQEGVDIPAVDCVMFADPKQSIVDIVQAAGRAMRPAPGKTFGYIALPIVVPSEMDFAHFAETTEFRQVARVVTALSTQDERIVEEFRAVDARPRGTGRIVEITGAVPVGTKIEFAQFADQIRLKLWEKVGRANWRPFEDARAFIHGLNIKSAKNYQKRCQQPDFPKDIPSAPDFLYKYQGWLSWGDWLGTGAVSADKIDRVPFEEARAFVHSLGLKNQKDWGEYLAGRYPDLPEKPIWLPSNPKLIYPNDWGGFPDWLGYQRQVLLHRDAMPFEKAREFVQGLGLKSSQEWLLYSRGGMPHLPQKPYGIPTLPSKTYADSGWVSMGDWLGTYNRHYRDRSLMSFEDAREFARTLQLRSQAEWWKYTKSEVFRKDIPATPYVAYGDSWISWNDWLGHGVVATRLRAYRSFNEARKFARQSGIKSSSEWFAWWRGNLAGMPPMPSDLPSKPNRTYSNQGWDGWDDFLGKDPIKPFGGYRPFSAAREFARGLGMVSGRQWRELSKAGRIIPSDIPKVPWLAYKGLGWTSMGDWLGTDRVATYNVEYLSFDEARRYARESAEISDGKTWRALWQQGRLPNGLPAYPESVYKAKGWAGWADFTGSQHHRRKRKPIAWRSFASAREYVRTLGLKSGGEWKKLISSNQLPDDIPAAPDAAYKDAGWVSWPDWLGYQRTIKGGNWMSFADARRLAQSLRLKSAKDWGKWCKGQHPATITPRPSNIPTSPHQAYRTEWIDWADWLGTQNTRSTERKYLPFVEARQIARGLNISSGSQWRKFAREHKIPSGVPTSPEQTYSRLGWNGWNDWLGTNPQKNKLWMGFDEAKKFVRSLNLSSSKSWMPWVRGEISDLPSRPENLPTHPERTYVERWSGWADWLGTK